MVHILHIGKTGGTAIRHALSNVSETRYGELVFHNHLTRLSDIPLGEKVAFFIRDPLNRYFSGFYSRKRKGAPRYNSEWSEEEFLAFEQFVSPIDILESAVNGSSDIRDKATTALNEIGHIKDHYDYWLGSCEYLSLRNEDILFVGFMETFEQDFDEFARLLEVDDSVCLPTSPVEAHVNPLYEKPALSLDQRVFFDTWFASDIELHKYCKERYAQEVIC